MLLIFFFEMISMLEIFFVEVDSIVDAN